MDDLVSHAARRAGRLSSQLAAWPDGELVTTDKLAAWLKEDILLRRVKMPTARQPKQQQQRQLTAAAAPAVATARAGADEWHRIHDLLLGGATYTP